MVTFVVGVVLGVVLGVGVAIWAGKSALDRLRARAEEAEEGYLDAREYHCRLLDDPEFYAAEWRTKKGSAVGGVIDLIERHSLFTEPHRLVRKRS